MPPPPSPPRRCGSCSSGGSQAPQLSPGAAANQTQAAPGPWVARNQSESVSRNEKHIFSGLGGEIIGGVSGFRRAGTNSAKLDRLPRHERGCGGNKVTFRAEGTSNKDPSSPRCGPFSTIRCWSVVGFCAPSSLFSKTKNKLGVIKTRVGVMQLLKKNAPVCQISCHLVARKKIANYV